MADDLPDGIARDAFCRLYGQHLNRHRPRFVEDLRHLLGRTDFTSPVEAIDFGVFPDESGDGHLSVWCYFTGRNTRVSSTEPSLFAGKAIHLTEGLRLPLHDPDGYDFHTADACVEVVMAWVASCWGEAGGDKYPIPATATAHDDCCGTMEVLSLNAAARNLERPQRKRSTVREKHEHGIRKHRP